MPLDADHAGNGEGATDAIEHRAADWLVLRDRGFAPREREEFTRWLEADERHAEVFAEMEETWERLKHLDDVASPAPAVLPVSQARTRQGGKIVWIATTLAAAAAVTVAVLMWPRSARDAADFSTTAATEIGAMRRLPLPDGSVVQINTDSALSIRFTATERRVQLVRGEAHFQVTKNPARPFIVSAEQVVVRAVGTAFDVRLRPEAVDVLVTEGKVRVSDVADGKSLLETPASSGEPPLLVAGQRISIHVGAASAAPPRAAVATIPAAEMGQMLAWQSKRLEFVSAPLAEMVAEFNRYNRHKLVIADPRLAERRFGGTFAAGDYDELVRLLEADFGVVAERGETETKLRLAR